MTTNPFQTKSLYKTMALLSAVQSADPNKHYIYCLPSPPPPPVSYVHLIHLGAISYKE